MYKKEKNMKKQMAKIVALIMAIVVITTMAACSGGVVATPENSYTISIYKEIKTQDQYGAVETTDYILWQSLNVIKTQMYDLPGGNNVFIQNSNMYSVENGEKKYKYEGYENPLGQQYKCSNGIKVLPEYDNTVFVRERQLKNIRFFIDGENIYDKLSEESKESFSKIYYGTYAESFSLNDTSYALLNYVREFLGRTIYSSDIKLYVGAQREKEISKGAYINLIQSTDVNIVIK